MLQTLTDTGIHLGVVSNKKGNFLRNEAKHLEWDRFFGALVGALVGYFHDGTALPMSYIIAGCVIGSAAAFWFLTGELSEKSAKPV